MESCKAEGSESDLLVEVYSLNIACCLLLKVERSGPLLLPNLGLLENDIVIGGF